MPYGSPKWEICALVAADELFSFAAWRHSPAVLPLMLGKGVDGEIKILDLDKAPHLFVAGSTGTGKSIFMRSCLCSLLLKHTPDELKLILVGSIFVEYDGFVNNPYLQLPIIKRTKDTLGIIQWLTTEMEDRYELLSEAGCETIQELNVQRPKALPYIVVFIDELADLMRISKSQTESLLAQLCAKSHDVGIHLIVATEEMEHRKFIKSMTSFFSARIAFRMNEELASFAFLNSTDAELLLGGGDMLYARPKDGELTRIQGVNISKKELIRVIERANEMKQHQRSLRYLYANDVAFRDKLVGITHDTLYEAIQFLKHTLGHSMEYEDDEYFCGVADEIAEAVIDYLDDVQEAHASESEADEKLSPEDKEMLLNAIHAVVVRYNCPYISYLQRCLNIGYYRAITLIDTMERYGIITPPSVDGNRRILVGTYEEALKCLPAQDLICPKIPSS